MVRWRNDRQRWMVRWREHGHNRSRLFRTEQDARDFDNEVYRRKRMGSVASLTQGTELLSEWGDYVFETYWRRSLQPATLYNYEKQWQKHVTPHLGDHKLYELTAGEVSRFATKLHQQGVGDATIRRLLSMLQRAMRYAVLEDKVATNSVREVDKPRQAGQEWLEPVEPLQVERILAELRRTDEQLLVKLMAYAGLRPGEALAAEWKHVTGRKLRVFAPKTRRNRTVDLIAPLAEDLAAARRPSGPIVARNGRRWTGDEYRMWRRRTWQPLAEKHLEGDDLRPYRLRGSFASLLAWEGRPMTYVAAQLGHSVQTCSRYYLGLFETFDPETPVSAPMVVSDARATVLRTPVVPPQALDQTHEAEQHGTKGGPVAGSS